MVHRKKDIACQLNIDYRLKQSMSTKIAVCLVAGRNILTNIFKKILVHNTYRSTTL
jgi:hypothetical protein